ncbi:T9SS type A sorting domain-containing protein [bacterium]|nr:T9SS type A sorting domain-containing protein [bacterium]
MSNIYKLQISLFIMLLLLVFSLGTTLSAKTAPGQEQKAIQAELNGKLTIDQYNTTSAVLNIQAMPLDNISYHTAKITWEATIYSFDSYSFKGNKIDFETFQGNSEFVVYIPPGQGVDLEIILELKGKPTPDSKFDLRVVSSTPENENQQNNPEVLSVYKELVLTGSAEHVAAQALPTEYSLLQNHPNPFNASTNIQFALPVDSQVKIRIYNVLGNEMVTLLNTEMPAGYHRVTWNGSDSHDNSAASGIYFAKMESGDFLNIIRMVMIK